MIDLTGSLGEHRIEIGIFQVRIVIENARARLSCGQQSQDVGNRDAQIANTRAPMHPLRLTVILASSSDICHFCGTQ